MLIAFHMITLVGSRVEVVNRSKCGLHPTCLMWHTKHFLAMPIKHLWIESLQNNGPIWDSIFDILALSVPI